MSGGSLNYVSGRMEDAAEQMQEWIRERTEPRPKKERNPLSPPGYGWGDEDWEYDWTPSEYYQQKNPDVPYLKTAEALKAKTKEYMEVAVRHMLAAAKMAHEAEWMMSGDTGPETFCMEVEKVIAELAGNGKQEEKE